MNKIPFHVMAKPVGPMCNLRCTYCFYLEKEKILGPKRVMSYEVLEEFIQQYIKYNPSHEIVFGWQGGEPTLAGLDFFKQAVTLQDKYKDGRRIVNTLQTNGTLLNTQWAEFFAEKEFLVGISIDGPSSIHDKFRVNSLGLGSFEKVVNSIQLLKKTGVEFNTLTCVHRRNWMKGKEIYHLLKSLGSKFMQFIPIVERITSQRNDQLHLALPTDDSAQITEWSILPGQWGDFLNTIFDEWIREDVGSIFVQIFDTTLAGWMGFNPPLCVFSKRCGNAVILEANGDIYACDHFVYPEYRLGNILDKSLQEMVFSEAQINFGLAKENLPNRCRSCSFRPICNGGCPKQRFLLCEGEKINYLCAGMYKFFEHTELYMKFMAEQIRRGLPPKSVMDFIKQNKSIFSFNKLLPNEPCPCGSGKKFKKCCGYTR